MTESTRLQAVGLFLKRRVGYSGPLTTDSQRLYSGGEVIAQWVGDKVVVTKDRDEKRTTHNHVEMLREMATASNIEVKE